jgi:hypothetical protein
MGWVWILSGDYAAQCGERLNIVNRKTAEMESCSGEGAVVIRQDHDVGGVAHHHQKYERKI